MQVNGVQIGKLVGDVNIWPQHVHYMHNLETHPAQGTSRLGMRQSKINQKQEFSEIEFAVLKQENSTLKNQVEQLKRRVNTL